MRHLAGIAASSRGSRGKIPSVRIGELLLERRAVPKSELAAALEEQARTKGRRLVSLLISRGVLEFDDGARALADHRGVPCALAKHLANRDPAAISLIPAELGRASFALPIGRTSGGAPIIAVRDPAPALLAALQHATRTDVVMIVTPATRLELLIAASYGAPPNDEFDIEVDSAIDLPIAGMVPPQPDLLDPDSMRLALSSLDDERVSKDPSQSGAINVQSSPGIRTRSTLPPVAPTLEATKLSLERASSRDAALDLAMSFIAGRWVSGLIVAVRDAAAVGIRGHAIDGALDLALPLDAPSTIERALATKQPSMQAPASEPQERLVRALRRPTLLCAVPVLLGGNVIAVIATGDPIHGSTDTKAPAELAQLGKALGAACERIGRT